MKIKIKFKKLTCCVFAVFLSLFLASGGRFAVASTVKQKIAQNGLRKLGKAIKTQQTHR